MIQVGIIRLHLTNSEGVCVSLGGEGVVCICGQVYRWYRKDGASLVERWIDETGNPMTERKIAQVMISICKWDNHQPVNEIQIDDLKFWKVNKVPSNTQPYIFDTGDKIVIDTEKSLVTINGKNAINIKRIL